MDPASSEGSNLNITNVEENVGSASDQSSLLSTAEENEESSVINPGPSTSTEEYSQATKRLRKEEPKKVNSHALAYPLIMLLIVFRQLIDGTKPQPTHGIYKTITDLALSLDNTLQPHGELFWDTLNADFHSLTFENILDKLKQSKTYLKELAPELFEEINALDDSDEGSSSASNNIENESLIKGETIYRIKFNELTRSYRFQLSRLKELAEADNSDTANIQKRSLRWIKDYMIENSPDCFNIIVLKKLKNFERKISRLKNEERIATINDELRIIKEAENAVNDYRKFRREILFCPSISSLKDLENKLQASAEKAKRLVPDFYDYATNEENFN